MKKTLFIKNAAILTFSSLILRFAGIIFKVWLAAKIGAEGIGLYQLVFSVYMFAATFATSGISTAVTRLVSEQLVTGNKSYINQIVKKGFWLSCAVAFTSMAILCFGGDFISTRLLQDARAALSLKILAFSLPFMGICSCVKGYFFARRKAMASSGSQLLEQIVRIALIVPLVINYRHLGLEYSCAAVILGDTIAEACSCLYVLIRYRIDFNKLDVPNNQVSHQYSLLPQILHIALPITSGRYLNSLLRMIENILVPIYLSNAVFEGGGMSLFGMIKGMALPILFFPSTLLNALSTLLLPEISEAAIYKKSGILRSIVSRIVKITFLVSVIISSLFLVCGSAMGKLIYQNSDVGFLLCALSPIVPFMYLDAVSDGILKGLDQQKFTFFTSVGDSAIRIVLIVLLLKRFGIYGFIGIMYFSNFLTGFLNTSRLLKISRVKPNFAKNVFLPVCCGFSICLLAKYVLDVLAVSNLLFVIAVCVICLPLYFIALFLLGTIDYDDISFIKRK